MNGEYGTSQLPLAGAVLCCTSIAPEQRSQLASLGAQMGATIKLDLTSDVTHLIVGSTNSDKYRYVAKSRDDVKVLLPAWLQALRDVWLQGHDNVDVAMLEKEYTLPTFFGLKICLTGFDMPEQRRHIQETVDRNGAEYHGDLTKSVTHLIAATPTGKKYEHAVNWRMKIVSLEWFEQSLERGMVLDEVLFNPTIPVELRGHGAWDRLQVPLPALGKRTRDTEATQSLNPFRRKLRRSASTKMGSQSEALWAGITAIGLERQQQDGDDWTDDTAARDDASRAPTPLTRVEDAEEDLLPDVGHPDERGRTPPVSANSIPKDGIFQQRVVLLHGFDEEKTNILREHLHDNDARIVTVDQLKDYSSDDLRRGYVVVPHDVEIDLEALPGRAGSAMSLVTNWWVERCLFGKCLFGPADYALSKPFNRLSISGFSDLTINSTGFVGIELLHVTKVVTLMGATYDEQLSGKTFVMICSSKNPNASKLKFATGKRIPAVHAAWLWECLRTGRLQAYDDYQINTLTSDQPQRPKQKPPPSAEVPTAKLSQEDSFKLQQRKSKTTAQGQQTRALDLALSADPTAASTINPLSLLNTSTRYSNPDQDKPALDGFDGHASLPLQAISANSPRRPSSSSTNSKPASRPRSSSAESLIKAAPAPLNVDPTPNPDPDSVIPPDSAPSPAEEKDYSNMLNQLRANRKAAPSPLDQIDGKRRRRRQLGRATSVRSNPSTGEGIGDIGLDGDLDEEGEERMPALDVYQPSQELGWDSPGAAKAREQMMKRLGGKISERSVPVKGIGVVKDVVGEIGGRRKRKG